ncbi:MAG TPA: serine/threonine-protein kinase, partial [Kofleriaceae bacterium]|nr:serine/threonine-protein kinase [Kofleriaceae bacterium]
MISSTTLEPGVVLLGKYRVDRVLGAGGMGMVLLAHHLQLQRPVAIKVLLPAMVAQREIVQRFLREAQAASRLTSEHVARVLDVGSLPDGAPYMVLEYLDGTDLARIGPGTLPTAVMIDLVLQACEALAEAHALGIVHRDLKPANLFVTRRADGEPQLKLLDFGISKTGSVADDRLTSTHSVMGTPSYMSPEQMRASREVDARADVWSLGAVLYELFQGAPPFEAETFTALCLAVTMDPPAPLTAAIPTRLRDAVLRCLEKAPASRFQSVGELAEALAPFASSPARAAMSVERIARTLASAPPAFRATVGSREASTTLRNAAGARTERNRARVETTRGRRAGAIIAGVAVAAGVVAAAAWRVDRHAETRLGAPVGSAPEPAPPERA